MEPPASPRKPRRPKISPENDTNVSPTPQVESTTPSPKSSKSPSRKTPVKVDTFPMDSAESALQSGSLSESSASVRSDEPSRVAPVREAHLPNTDPAVSVPAPQVEKMDVEAPVPPAPEPPLTLGLAAAMVELSIGKQGIAIMRTLAMRNIEITHKASRHVGHAVNGFIGQISRRVSSVEIGGKPIQTVVRETGSNLGKQPGLILTSWQEQLQHSDAAVIGSTLFLILACILLTLLAVYLWNLATGH